MTPRLICVKEFAKYSFCSPKFFPSEKTFLNANIKSNSDGGFPAGSNSTEARLIR